MNYTEKLINMPNTGGGVHQYILGIANVGILQGIPLEQIVADIQRAWLGPREPAPDEIEGTVRKAAKENGTWMPNTQLRTDPTGMMYAAPELAPLAGQQLVRYYIDRGSEFTAKNIRSHSPVTIPEDPIEQFATLAQTLYRPDEMIYCGPVTHNGGKRWDKAGIFSVEEHIAAARDPQFGLGPRPFMCPNPYTGIHGEKKDGGMSLRCDSTIADHRFFLGEYDEKPDALMTAGERSAAANYRQLCKRQGKKNTPMPSFMLMPIESQIRFWMGSGLPVAALIFSGSKSVHAWVRVDLGTDREAWDEIVGVQLFGRCLAPMGLDRAVKNPSRLSRMAGHDRENGHRQHLLYLNELNGN